MFIGRLHEACRGSQYSKNVSLHHFWWDNLINGSLIIVSCLAAVALFAYNSMPTDAWLHQVPLISGIVMLVSEAVRQLSRQIFQHSQKAEAMRLVSRELSLTFEKYEVVFVKVLKGQLSEQEIMAAADGLSLSINKSYDRLPEGMIFPLYEKLAVEADRYADSYFCKNFNFSK